MASVDGRGPTLAEMGVSADQLIVPGNNPGNLDDLILPHRTRITTPEPNQDSSIPADLGSDSLNDNPPVIPTVDATPIDTTTPTTTEQASNEIGRSETQKRELEQVSNLILDKKGKEIDTTVKGDERGNEKNGGILWWRTFLKANPGFQQHFDSSPLKDAFIFPDGRVLTDLSVAENGDFSCTFSNGQTESITRQEFLNKQLLMEQGAILDLFAVDSPERKAIQLQIDLLAKSQEAPSPEVIDTIIQNAAEANNLITAFQIEEIVRFRIQALASDTQKNGIQKQQEHQWLEKILQATEGKTILETETLRIMMLSPDFENDYKAIGQKLEQMEKNQQTSEADYIHLKAVKTMLDAAKTKLADPAYMFEGTGLEGIANGTADKKTITLFMDSIRNGNPLEVIEKLYPAKTKEEELKRAEFRKKTGNTILQFLVMMAVGMWEPLSGEFLPSFDQQRR